MRKKLRPDVASDTSRRNNNCVATQQQIRRDENEGTNSHDGNIWQLKQRIQTFFIFSSPV